MDKKFLQSKSLKEVQKKFEEELNQFSADVAKITDRTELEKLEQDIIKEQDKVKEFIKTVTFDLPAEVLYDGERFGARDIVNKIIYFLNKKEVEWQYTRGMLELVKFWKTDNCKPTKIEYGAYDSTLRLLNQIPYKGYTEWRDINAVNEYFKGAHESYSKDTLWVYFASNKQNIVVDRMKQLDDLKNEIEGDGKVEEKA